MLPRYARIMRTIIAGLFLLLVSCRSAAPDLVLAGGKIFTADDRRPWAEALAVSGDRIVAVGTNAQVRALAGPSTRVVELEGRVVVPGINDAHIHEPGTLGGVFLRVPEGADVPRIYELVREAAGQHPPGTLLRATIPADRLGDARLTRAELDALAPRHPVMLGIPSGHAMLNNSAALTMRGLADDVQDRQDGWYGRDANGRLDGWLYEYALWRSSREIGERQSDAAYAEELREFSNEVLRYGITSVQTMPMIDMVRSRRIATGAGLPPLRWRWIDLRMDGVTDEPAGAVKYILDGTPMERGAAMRADYADAAGARGRINYSDADITRMVRAAAATDKPLLVHVSGDAPLEKLFSIMRATPADWKAKRVRVEHGDWVGEFMDEARDLGVVIVQNPSHFMIPGLVQKRFGDERLRTYMVFRSVPEHGIPLAVGSDGPVNPWLNMMFATMHPRNPSEAMGREPFVTAYTRGSAYAEFQEQEKGTLAPGMLADLAVLSQDVFTVAAPELPKTTSVLTIVGGKIAWEQR